MANLIFFFFRILHLWVLCNIINVFAVIYDEFHASLVNKSIYLFQQQKFLLTGTFWIAYNFCGQMILVEMFLI